MKRFLLLLFIICMAVSAAMAEDEYKLPVSLTPGYEPNPACFTKDGYEDPSLSVKMEQVIYNNVRVNLAWIQVKSPGAPLRVIDLA